MATDLCLQTFPLKRFSGFLQVSVLEEKKSGDVLTRFTLTLRLSIAFRTKGGFLDSVELSLSLRFS